MLGTLRRYRDQGWEVADISLDYLVLLAEFIGPAMNYTTVKEALCEISDVLHRRVPAHIFEDKCSQVGIRDRRRTAGGPENTRGSRAEGM